jgi:hypothetical protein
VNRPKTLASAQAVPVIRQLAEILNAYRLSMGNPQSGVMFHSGGGQHMDFDKLSQNLIRPAVEALRLEWYGWHGFRRAIASNLYDRSLVTCGFACRRMRWTTLSFAPTANRQSWLP